MMPRALCCLTKVSGALCDQVNWCLVAGEGEASAEIEIELGLGGGGGGVVR